MHFIFGSLVLVLTISGHYGNAADDNNRVSICGTSHRHGTNQDAIPRDRTNVLRALHTLTRSFFNLRRMSREMVLLYNTEFLMTKSIISPEEVDCVSHIIPLLHNNGGTTDLNVVEEVQADVLEMIQVLSLTRLTREDIHNLEIIAGITNIDGVVLDALCALSNLNQDARATYIRDIIIPQPSSRCHDDVRERRLLRDREIFSQLRDFFHNLLQKYKTISRQFRKK